MACLRQSPASRQRVHPETSSLQIEVGTLLPVSSQKAQKCCRAPPKTECRVSMLRAGLAGPSTTGSHIKLIIVWQHIFFKVTGDGLLSW